MIKKYVLAFVLMGVCPYASLAASTRVRASESKTMDAEEGKKKKKKQSSDRIAAKYGKDTQKKEASLKKNLMLFGGIALIGISMVWYVYMEEEEEEEDVQVMLYDDNDGVDYSSFETRRDNPNYDIRYYDKEDVYTLTFEDFKISYRFRKNACQYNLVVNPLVKKANDKNEFRYGEKDYIKATEELKKRLPTLKDKLEKVFGKIKEAKKNNTQEKLSIYYDVVTFAKILPKEITTDHVASVGHVLDQNFFKNGNLRATACVDGLSVVVDDLSILFGNDSLENEAIDKAIMKFKVDAIVGFVIKTYKNDTGAKKSETVGIKQAVHNSIYLDDLRNPLGLKGLPRRLQLQGSGNNFYGWNDIIRSHIEDIRAHVQEVFTLYALLSRLNMDLYCPKGNYLNRTQKKIESSSKKFYRNKEKGKDKNGKDKYRDDDPIKKTNSTAYFNQGLDLDKDLEVTEVTITEKDSDGNLKTKKLHDSKFKYNKLYSTFTLLHMLTNRGLLEATLTHDEHGRPNFGQVINRKALDTLTLT